MRGVRVRLRLSGFAVVCRTDKEAVSSASRTGVSLSLEGAAGVSSGESAELWALQSSGRPSSAASGSARVLRWYGFRVLVALEALCFSSGPSICSDCDRLF